MNFACLDIETSWEHDITIIGVYRSGEGTTQLIAPAVDHERLRLLLTGMEVVFTYNGSGFDLRVIEKQLGLKVTDHCRHHDLMHDCRKRKWTGGLKGVEKLLGIHRDSEGLNGLDAMHLWRAHQYGHAEALEILLRYNKEDVENLEILAQKLGILEPKESV
jgi:uncharacterized protein YprB with RNaseH-like and TPR domain